MSNTFEDYLTVDNFKRMKANARLVQRKKKNVWDAYAHFKVFFTKKQSSVDNLILASSVSYSWMPTMLDIHTQKGIISIKKASKALSIIRNINTSSDLNNNRNINSAITQLKEVINNSMVGASKVMHLFHDQAPIIDSRVIKSWNYFFGNRNMKISNNVNGYLNYWKMILYWQKIINTENNKATVRDIEVMFFDFAEYLTKRLKKK